jgi:A/G-specific adenine glycosylase
MEQVSIWFLKNQRNLPWREGKDPYSVLVSEVMLQQTRAVVVIPYFRRWMSRFPTLVALSEATEVEVVKLWEGLGYYSRARNLLELAKTVVSQYEGKLPNSLEELLKLKGLGPYTAGAILSFGFYQKAVALDGNVERVIARFVGFKKEVKKHGKELRQIVYDFLPDKEPYITMEGLIELGATICAKKPLCNLCPLSKSCLAYKMGMQEILPILPERKPITELFRFVACILHQDQYLVKQGEKGKLMEGLFEFPYIDIAKDFILSESQNELEKSLDLPLTLIAPLPREKHHFTRFKANLIPFHFRTSQKKSIPGYTWLHKNDLNDHPFSSGHLRILKKIV